MWVVVRRNASNRETKKEKLQSNKSATSSLCACAVVFKISQLLAAMMIEPRKQD